MSIICIRPQPCSCSILFQKIYSGHAGVCLNSGSRDGEVPQHSVPAYGYNRPGAKISEGIRDKWWLQGMMGGMKAGYDCIKAFSETDFTEDLKKFDVPTLILHGDDDQIVPIGAAALQSSKLVKGATLKVYPGFPHGMPSTHADQINTVTYGCRAVPDGSKAVGAA